MLTCKGIDKNQGNFSLRNNQLRIIQIIGHLLFLHPMGIVVGKRIIAISAPAKNSQLELSLPYLPSTQFQFQFRLRLALFPADPPTHPANHPANSEANWNGQTDGQTGGQTDGWTRPRIE